MRIAVCDDEKAVRDMLIEKIQKNCQQTVVFSYESGKELLAERELPDILFLDIQMPGMDGMEAAEEMRKRNRDMIIIFVTATEEYVFQAFDVGAFHYLVKPFSEQKFAAVLANAVSSYEQRTQEKASLDARSREEKYIMVKTGGIQTKVILRDMIYAEVFNRKITIHMTDGDVEYYGKISELEKQAGADFFRCHRGYLVHFKYVVRYSASMVYLEQGTALMAKSKYQEFVRGYLKYNQRMGGDNHG